jgi:hypothetical protein
VRSWDSYLYRPSALGVGEWTTGALILEALRLYFFRAQRAWGVR